MPEPANTYRQQLRDVALDQYGYVTTADAAKRGVPSVELRKLAHRGFLERVGRGLYRFRDIPVTEYDQYMEAVLWAGPGALLSHDGVLALHALAFVNPSTLRVTVPARVRKARPRRDVTLVVADLPEEDRTVYEGIPSTTVGRALRDARRLVMPDRLLEAAQQARARGLLSEQEYQHTLGVLGVVG